MLPSRVSREWGLSDNPVHGASVHALPVRGQDLGVWLRPASALVLLVACQCAGLWLASTLGFLRVRPTFSLPLPAPLRPWTLFLSFLPTSFPCPAQGIGLGLGCPHLAPARTPPVVRHFCANAVASLSLQRDFSLTASRQRFTDV